jgi:hypothetical protein
MNSEGGVGKTVVVNTNKYIHINKSNNKKRFLIPKHKRDRASLRARVARFLALGVVIPLELLILRLVGVVELKLLNLEVPMGVEELLEARVELGEEVDIDRFL